MIRVLDQHATISETFWFNGSGENNTYIGGIEIFCTTAELTSAVTLTVRWNDGIADRVKTWTMSLASTSNRADNAYTFLLGAGQDLTYEVTYTGLGTSRYGINLTMAPGW